MKPLVLYLLLCLLTLRAEGGLYFRCPLHPCLCESGDMGLVMNCRQRFLTRIPPVIESDLLFQEISLKKNNIRHLGTQAFKGIKVKKIDLSENIITSIDDDAFEGVEDILEELVIQVYNMEGLPLKALHKLNVLRVLHVIGCKVPVISNSTFSLIPTLQEIRLISCGIEEVELDAFDGVEGTLKVLDFFGNNLKTVPSTALVRLDAVEKMVLTGNQLKQVEENSFLGMTSLRHLELSSNGIYSIHPMAFEGIQTSLEFLGLQRNRLKANDLVALRILRNLNQLELAYNQIENIPRRLFRNLNRVTLIGLQSNKIQGINRLTFAGTEQKLKVLLLSDNDVNVISPNTFQGFRCLRHLYLDRTNAGSGLSRHSFKGLAGSLETLNMQRSGFTASGFVAISNLGELKTLVLRDNQITSLMPRVFSKLRRLTRLDLQGNKLESITNPATFQGLEKSLRQLVLSNNMISTLSECVFEKFEQLRDIVLNQNPLICDCKLLWLKRWVISKTSTFSRNTLNWICAGPRIHAGKLFRAIRDEEMVCPEEIKRARCPPSPQYPIVSTTTPITPRSKSSEPPTNDYISTDSTLSVNIPMKMSTPSEGTKTDGKVEQDSEPPKMQLLLPNIDDPILNQDSFYNDIIQRTVQLMASKIEETSIRNRSKSRSRHRFRQPLNTLMTTPGRSKKRTLARWLSSTRKMNTKPAWTSGRPTSRQNIITNSSSKTSESRSTVALQTDITYRTSTETQRTATVSISATPVSTTINSSPLSGTPNSTSTTFTSVTSQTEQSLQNARNITVIMLKPSQKSLSEADDKAEKSIQKFPMEDTIEKSLVNLTSAAASGKIRSTSHGLKSNEILQSEQNSIAEDISSGSKSQALPDTTSSTIISTTSRRLPNTDVTSYSTKFASDNFQNATVESHSTILMNSSLPEERKKLLQSPKSKVVSTESSNPLSEVTSQTQSEYFNTTESLNNVTYRSKLDETTNVNDSNSLLESTAESRVRNPSVTLTQGETVTSPSVITKDLNLNRTLQPPLAQSKYISVETQTTLNIQLVSGKPNHDQMDEGLVTRSIIDSLLNNNKSQEVNVKFTTKLSTPFFHGTKNQPSTKSVDYSGTTNALADETPAVTDIQGIENTTPIYQKKLQKDSSLGQSTWNISMGSRDHSSNKDLNFEMPSLNSMVHKNSMNRSSEPPATTYLPNTTNINKSFVAITSPLKSVASSKNKESQTDFSVGTSTSVPQSTQILPTTAPDNFLSTGKGILNERYKHVKTGPVPTEYIIKDAKIVSRQTNDIKSVKSTKFPTPTPAHDPTSVVKPSKPTSFRPGDKRYKRLRNTHYNQREGVLLKSTKDTHLGNTHHNQREGVLLKSTKDTHLGNTHHNQREGVLLKSTKDTHLGNTHHNLSEGVLLKSTKDTHVRNTHHNQSEGVLLKSTKDTHLRNTHHNQSEGVLLKSAKDTHLGNTHHNQREGVLLKSTKDTHLGNTYHNQREGVLLKSTKDKILELLSNQFLSEKLRLNSSKFLGDLHKKRNGNLLDLMQTTIQATSSERNGKHKVTASYATSVISQKTTGSTDLSLKTFSSLQANSPSISSTAPYIEENTNSLTGVIKNTSPENTESIFKSITVSKDSRNPYSKAKAEPKHLYTGKPRTVLGDMSVIKNWLNSALAGDARKYVKSSGKALVITTTSTSIPDHNEGRIKNPYESLRNFKGVNSRLYLSGSSDGFQRKDSVQGKKELTLHTTMPIPSTKTNNVKEKMDVVNSQKDRAELRFALNETSGTRSLGDSFKNRDNYGGEEASYQQGSLPPLPNLKPGPVESNRRDRKDQEKNKRPSNTTNTYIGPRPGTTVPESSATIDRGKNENIAWNITDKLSTLLTRTAGASGISHISTTESLNMDSANTSSENGNHSKQNAVLEEILSISNRSKVDRYTIPDFSIFVSVLPYANDAVKVTWNVSHEYAVSGFRVYYGDTANETLVEGPSLGRTVRTYDVTSLVSDEKYTFCVVAYLSDMNKRKSGQCKEAKINFKEEQATISSHEKTKTLALIIGSYAAGALVLVTLLLSIALLVRRYRDKSKSGLYVPRASPYWIEFLCGGIATSRYSTTVLDSSTATVSSGVEMSENDSHSDSEESGTYSFDYSLRSLPAQHIWSTADLHTNLYTY